MRKHRSVTPERAKEIGKQRVSVYAEREQVDALKSLSEKLNVSRNKAAGLAWVIANEVTK